MTKYLLAAILCMIPALSWAEVIVLRSGEHADFSRIVVQFDTAPEWQFGRVTGGYELRSDAQSATFDTSDVFRFIPRSRIAAISSPGPGRLFLEVTCQCLGDAFEIRRGRLVLDIKDASPIETARFESALAPLQDGASWQPNPVGAAPDDDAEIPVGGVDFARLFLDTADADNKPIGLIPVPAAPDLAMAEMPDMDMPAEAGPDMTNVPPGADSQAMAVPGGQETSQTPSGAAPEAPSMVSVTEMSAEPEPEPEPTMRAPGEFLPSWPALSDLPLPGINDAQSSRIAAAELALLTQLGRAAAQGLIRLDLPVVTPNQEPVEQISDQPDPDPAVDAAPQDLAQLSIETVIDRDATRFRRESFQTSAGIRCLPAELFQISDWGPEAIEASPFSGLRTGIVREFDTPDPAAIAALAKRYIYLGFGAETKLLINAFEAEIAGADILLDMAQILDFGAAAGPGRLATQLTCSTPAALWAVLAEPEIPAGAEIDVKSVLGTFSALPAHLRRQVGPGLVDRFLARGDGATAASIRHLADRAANNRDAGFQMMEAQIAAFDGDIPSALRNFEAVANSSGASAPLALVNLIETELAAELAVDPKTATLADAMAVEYRGTDIGRRLTRAAIRGFAVSGQVETTFERIRMARQNGDLTPQESQELTAEAHLRSAQNSSDADFLMTVYRYRLTVDGDVKNGNAAHRAVSARLIDLGLPAKAQQIYADAGFSIQLPDQILLARAGLDLGDINAPSRYLDGLSDAQSRLLFARASEMRRDYGRAAEIFRDLDMTRDRDSTRWRARDWQAIAVDGSGPQAVFAQLILDGDSQPSAVPEQVAQATEAGSGSPATSVTSPGQPPPTISAGKALLARSLATREAVESLLKIP